MLAKIMISQTIICSFQKMEKKTKVKNDGSHKLVSVVVFKITRTNYSVLGLFYDLMPPFCIYVVLISDCGI